MATDKELKLQFKIDNANFKKALSENTQAVSTLNKEFKLQQEQLKLSGSETDKLTAQLANLEQKHAAASERVQLISQRLEEVKSKYGGNTEEVRKLEGQLLSAQTAEQKYANQITETKAKLAEAKQASSDYAQQLKTLEAEEQQLSSSADKAKKQMELQAAQMRTSTSESDKLKVKLNGLGEQYKISAEQVKNLEKQLELAKKVYGENSAEVDTLENKLIEAKTAQANFAAEIKETTKEIIAQGGKLGELGDKVKAVGEKMTSTGKTLSTHVTAPLLALGTAAVATAASFEQGMAEVQAISGATGEDFTRLQEKAKEMGATTVLSASDAADALKFMAMAGWETNAMIDALPAVMNLAIASGENLGAVSDIVTDAMTAFGLKANEAARFTDVLATASSASNTNVGLMGETFKYAAPLAGSLGYSVEDVALAVGLMANSGIKGSQAGTALTAMFNSLLKPSDKAREKMQVFGITMAETDGTIKPLKKLLDEFRGTFFDLSYEIDAWNVSLVDANGEARENDDIIRELTEHGLDYSKAVEMGNIATIFGTRGLSALLPILGASEEEYNKLTEAINNSSGSTQKMADIMGDTLQGKMTMLSSATEGVAIQLGDILIPHVLKVVEKINELVTWFGNLDKSTQENIVKWAALAAAIGPVLIIFGKVTEGVGSIMKAGGSLIQFVGSLGGKFATMGTTAAGAAGQVASTGTAMAGAAAGAGGLVSGLTSVIGTVGLVAGAVAAAIGVFHLIKSAIEGSKEAAFDYNEAMSSNAETMKDVNNRMQKIVDEQKAALKEKYTALAHEVETALVGMGTASAEEIEAATANLKTSISNMTATVKSEIDSQVASGTQTVLELMRNTNQLTDSEGQEILKTLTTNGQAQKIEVEAIEKKINKIIETELDERGNITEKGMTEIRKLQQKILSGQVDDFANSNSTMLADAYTFEQEYGALNKKSLKEYTEVQDEKYKVAVDSSKDLLAQRLAEISSMKGLDETSKQNLITAAQQEHDLRINSANKTRQDSFKILTEMYKERYDAMQEDLKTLETYQRNLKLEYDKGNISYDEYCRKMSTATKDLGLELDHEFMAAYKKIEENSRSHTGTMLEGAGKFMTNLMGEIQPTLRMIPSETDSELQKTVKNTHNRAQELAQAMSAAASGSTSKMNEGIKTGLATVGTTMASNFKTAVDGAYKKAGTAVDSGNATLKSKLNSGGKSSATALQQGLISGITSMTNTLINKMASLAASMIASFNKKARTASPSKETYQSGTWLMQGIQKAVEKMAPGLIGDMGDLAENMIDEYNEGIRNADNAAMSAPETSAARGMAEEFKNNVLENGGVLYKIGQMIGGMLSDGMIDKLRMWQAQAMGQLTTAVEQQRLSNVMIPIYATVQSEADIERIATRINTILGREI